MPHLTVDTPTGPVTLTEEAGAITAVVWGAERAGDHTPLLHEAARQLTAYFTDPSQGFDLPLLVHGSDFQRAVCAAMQAIPLGETRTYGELARDLGVPAQAVGQACGGNPIPVIIPCHRILGASGLGGFSGGEGVETKVWLLRHEGAGGLLI
ncbi:methylated-DNA--[protein]-cysteine S-methyltransferase [Rhodalgimonas zhirmunskyi]|uniref:Methylated-DNA--protein-cysteine methyltransferase n=1 Tax=Rhodalgimonas zhirmunskyi TaxID=2964767 RepID=A0AAJ1U4V1_9RHOB|nr:methylated-DNA--[protein]-cysteine S-methyltransferase [Rhodoalgimonas zhirmunskyi]MDQ2093730.1 methylated-DNA--[protein]-cysteine S-methyltransferase [Rhodoalgimonas zhirmunskyi]